MATRKVATVDLKGKDYATVPARLKLFREDCPNGTITTDYKFLEDGQVIFTATVIKDASKPDSGSATGHAMGKMTSDKAFEKHETISIGRALAILGYLASGEVASSEEMEEYAEYRNEKINEVVGTIKQIDNMEELKKYFISLGGLMAESAIIKAKDEQKVKLSV